MFKNKVVIVTGGSSGIGAATAQLFAKEGARVVIVGRNEIKLNDVNKRCEELGAKTLIIKADIAKDEEAKTIVEQTINTFGKLDILVNNAGTMKMAGILQDSIMEAFDETINTNLRSVIFITKLAAPYLIQTKGNVVNISSVISTMNPSKVPELSTYAISKAGLDIYTRAAAFELASSGVRVNAVNPGPVITDMFGAVAQANAVEQDAMIAHMTALGRASQAEEIGDMILYLASDKAEGITGSCFVVDNGTLLK